MASNGLRTAPHDIPKMLDKAWWYEEPAGIYVVVEPHESTQGFYISWRALRAALARKDALTTEAREEG